MKILGIETSCDETALALIEAEGDLSRPKFKIIKSLVASQIKIHRPFGGVVPNLAKREHLKNLPILWQRMMNNELRIKGGKNSVIHNSKSLIHKIDLIAVTVGPGLEPALWTGINFAKALINADQDADKRRYISENPRRNQRKSAKLQLVGVNHLEGHLYSFLLPSAKKTKISNFSAKGGSASGGQFPISKLFPAIALIVSGGHTILLLVKDLKTWKKLGETRDDAAGEAFDKVARLLNLPYPGGPEIEKIAQKGNPKAIDFPRPMIHNNSPAGEYDFSFSGLKTAVLYYLREHSPQTYADSTRTNAEKFLRKSASSQRQSALAANVAASFQQAAIDVLVAKTIHATKEHNAKTILLSGGVASNKLLRETLRRESKKTGKNFFVSDLKYNTDNAVMIAAAGYFAHLRKKKYKLEAQGNLDI